MKKYCLIGCIICMVACDKKEPAPQKAACVASYNTDIKPLVQNKCAVAGCHGSNGLANLNEYNILKALVDSSKVKTYVFDMKLMPPATAAQLSDAEKEKLQCWLTNGASQN